MAYNVSPLMEVAEKVAEFSPQLCAKLVYLCVQFAQNQPFPLAAVGRRASFHSFSLSITQGIYVENSN